MGSRQRPRLALGVLVGAALVHSFNFSIFNVALADLVEQLGATTSDLQWALNAFTLVFGGLMLSAATLGDRIGRSRALKLGMSVAVVGAALATQAPTPGALIACRAVTGAAAALVAPVSLSILATLYSD